MVPPWLWAIGARRTRPPFRRACPRHEPRIYAAKAPEAPAGYFGSHVDSVPEGGNFDGLAGVVAAIGAAVGGLADDDGAGCPQFCDRRRILRGRIGESRAGRRGRAAAGRRGRGDHPPGAGPGARRGGDAVPVGRRRRPDGHRARPRAERRLGAGGS